MAGFCRRGQQDQLENVSTLSGEPRIMARSADARCIKAVIQNHGPVPVNFSHGSDPAASPICRSAIPHRGVEITGPQALFSGTW
jgi:hypothetical protein